MNPRSRTTTGVRGEHGDGSAAGDPGGPPIGVLMLETRFPRPPGDIGNPATFPFPVLYRVVAGATPNRVVEQQDPKLLDSFIEGARALEADGVGAITTSCGFLVAYQRRLAAAVGVPVLTSSLLLYPSIRALLPAGRRVGILTASRRGLTDQHLAAAAIPPDDVVIRGLEETGVFFPAIVGNRPVMDLAAARREVVEAARALVGEAPDVGALLFECTNLGPYSADAERATGRAVFDIVGAVHWLRRGRVPRDYSPEG